MTTVDITLGDNTSEQELNPIALVPYMPLMSKNISVIYGMIKGTEGKEWLMLAENEFSKMIKTIKNG
jgi:hypothetical protein